MWLIIAGVVILLILVAAIIAWALFRNKSSEKPAPPQPTPQPMPQTQPAPPQTQPAPTQPAPTQPAPPPVVVPEYEFVRDIDIDGFNINGSPEFSDVDKLKIECAKDDNCVAFNTDGYLKSQLPELSSSTWKVLPIGAGGTYVKKSAAPAARNYKFHQGVDSEYNDILYTASHANDVNALKRLCDYNKDCRGFNTNGFLKNVIKPSSSWVRWTADPLKGMYAV